MRNMSGKILRSFISTYVPASSNSPTSSGSADDIPTVYATKKRYTSVVTRLICRVLLPGFTACLA